MEPPNHRCWVVDIDDCDEGAAVRDASELLDHLRKPIEFALLSERDGQSAERASF